MLLMKRVIDVDMEIRCKKFKTALDRFFKKNSNLSYWRETFEWMYENGKDFFSDGIDGTGNKVEWSYALHLDVYEDHYYIAIIERA